MAVLFNTHEFFTRLEKAGFSRDQAESITTTFAEVQEQALEQAAKTTLATKEDIGDVRKEIQDVRKEIQDVRNEVKSSKIDLIKWMMAMGLTLILFQVGLAFAMLRFLLAK